MGIYLQQRYNIFSKSQHYTDFQNMLCVKVASYLATVAIRPITDHVGDKISK